MFGKNRRASTIAIGCGITLTALAAGAGAATSTDGPLSCTIEATSVGGGITLEGRVEAAVPVSGSYQLQVQSAGYSGSTSFRQGGGFTATSGAEVALGRIILGDASSIYDATLEIAADDASVTCAKRIGGKI